MFDVLLNHLPGPSGLQYKADAEAISRLLIRGYISASVATDARALLGERIETALLNKSAEEHEELYHVDQAI